MVNGAMQDWWGSESFGQRRMLGLTPLFAIGLRRGPRVPAAAPAGAAARPRWPALIAWNLQFAYIFNSEMLATRTQAVSLDRLAAAQVDVLYRTVARHEQPVPPRLFLLLYDNLKGVWLDEGPRSLQGRVDLGGEEQEELRRRGRAQLVPRPTTRETWACAGRAGRSSWLRLPIRTPADFDAVLRARSEIPGATVRVTVEVNGTVVGTPELGSGWSDARFVVPATVAAAGIQRAVARVTRRRRASATRRTRDATRRSRSTP